MDKHWLHEPRLPNGEWTKAQVREWIGAHAIDPSNIVDMWQRGDKGEHEAGEVWYPNAHKVAVALAKRHGVSIREAAGLLAAYSPQTAWGQNVRNASEVLREKHGVGGPGAHIWWDRDQDPSAEEYEGIMAPGTTKKRANRILAGEDFEDVFAGKRNKHGNLPPKSLKIRAFGELIANGHNDPDHPRVVIDRHAAGVARGIRMTEEEYGVEGPSSSRKKFAAYADAYKQAAETISKIEGRIIPPEAVQAATWLTRQRLNAELESRVGRTRKSLGHLDADRIHAYAEEYLPEILETLPKTGYEDLSVLDFAVPGERLKRKVQPKRHLDVDSTVRSIARVLMQAHRLERVGSDIKRERVGLVALLKPYGIKPTAIRMALGLTHFEGGSRKGTAHSPNARLKGHNATLTGDVLRYRDAEVYYRAAYVANAAQRIQRSLDSGATEQEALRREAPHYQSHEHARKGRLESAAQVQTAARIFGWPQERGHLVGWYLNPLLNNEAECIAASGHNFYAEEGTVIGLPGSVHNNCGCYAGPPWAGSSLVNDVFKNTRALHRGGSSAKFQVKKPLQRKGA